MRILFLPVFLRISSSNFLSFSISWGREFCILQIIAVNILHLIDASLKDCIEAQQVPAKEHGVLKLAFVEQIDAG